MWWQNEGDIHSFCDIGHTMGHRFWGSNGFHELLIYGNQFTKNNFEGKPYSAIEGQVKPQRQQLRFYSLNSSYL